MSELHPADQERRLSPPQEAITAGFQGYINLSGQSREVVPIAGYYGAVCLPPEWRKAVLAVDLCEVLRCTGRACSIALQRPEVDQPYGLATGFTDDGAITTLIQDLMHEDRVPPVPGAPEIRMCLARLRQWGVLVLANTSTLPGCELPTIRFLSTHFADAFDGINFNTGGHHATDGRNTKADAVRAVLAQVDPDFAAYESDLWVGSVDDRPHHNKHYYSVFPKAAVHTYAPLCQGEDPEQVNHYADTVTAASPAEAFHLMQYDLGQWLFGRGVTLPV